ncbi:ubiquinone biosynthesis O-methyltransferase, mitochondrial [Bacillus rossius redtenbacheri]|uniref:ubiquinone biosynthesis O-methyltransferase, mitochondrial n=1 Tax=Bacillus rossius redtenbacheri TaxID=93214 RepID=UPI002FDEFC5C
MCVNGIARNGTFPIGNYLRWCLVSRSAHIAASKPQSTVDENDIKLYNQLVDRWWDENGEMKALHSMNALRVPFIRDGLIQTNKVLPSLIHTGEPLQGLKILEVGCGGGILTEPLARLGAEVTGVDASRSMVETAERHAAGDPGIGARLRYVLGTIEAHTCDHREHYDAVVASEVLEHVLQKDLFVEACSSSLKPGGSFFVTTLNRTWLTWAAGILLAEYVLHLLPRGTHDFNKCVSPHGAEALLAKHGNTTRLIHGMCYNFVTNEWHWTSNLSINYAIHAIKS